MTRASFWASALLLRTCPECECGGVSAAAVRYIASRCTADADEDLLAE
jgi:hypothetical protein